MLAVWIALGVFGVALVAGVWFAAFRALALFRELRALREELGSGLEQIADAAADVERRVEALARRSTELQTRVDKLSGTLERASILAAALRDVRDAVGRVSAVYPRK